MKYKVPLAATIFICLSIAVSLLASGNAGVAQDRCYVHDKSGNLTQILEANLMSDPLNCGSCGNRCDAAMPLCKAGKCSACEPQTDSDCDGIDNSTDNCRFVKNPLQVDVDQDQVGDVCDNCPTVPNLDQLNTDGASDGGDACDPDDDNDLCLDGQDDKPTQDSSIVGWRIAVLCSESVQDVYGWDGADSDGDGLRQCMDSDDDNDGVLDAEDPCPIDPGTDQLQCQAAAISCPVTTLLNVCLLGGCNEFVIRIVSVINPGLIVQNFTIRGQSMLVLFPNADQSLEALTDAVLDQRATKGSRSKRSSSNKVRLEIWSKDHRGRPGSLIAKGATYTPRKVSRLRTGGSVLLLTLGRNGAVKSIHEAAVPPPANGEAYPNPIQRPRTTERLPGSKRKR